MSGDELLFNDSYETSKTREPFVSRQMSYIVDQNNSSYTSGQVQLDTSSLSNSGKWASYSEGYLVIPLILALYPSADDSTNTFNDAAANFALGLKNSYTQLLHSFSVEYNNTTVIQLTPFSNIHINYRMMQSFSKDDVQKIGSSIGFYPDTPDSWQYSASATWDGVGESNNRNMGYENIYPTNWGRIFTAAAITDDVGVVGANTAAGTPVNGIYTTHNSATTSFNPPACANFGFYMRQKMISTNPSVAPWSSLLTLANTQQILKNYYYSYNSGGTTGYKAWFINAIVRLRDMHDFFMQTPLLKGSYLRFVINLNLAQTTVTVGTQAVSGSTAPTQVPAGVTLTQSTTTLTNGTNPCLLASACPGNGMDSVAVTGTTLNIAMGIASLAISPPTGATTLRHGLNSCRLYVPLYTMSNVAESAYIAANKVKVIEYRDIFNYRFNGIGANESFSFLATNGIVNAKSIVIIPFFNSDSSTGNYGGFSPYQSIFSTAPATSSPLAVIGNFNIQLAGQNVFMINETYDWSNYVDEAQHAHALNGGLMTGLTSGLESEYSWSQCGRTYVANLARRISAEDSTPKSILILGTNFSSRKIDIMAFVEVGRSISVNVEDGQLLQ
jgi:hypothetical protein